MVVVSFGPLISSLDERWEPPEGPLAPFKGSFTGDMGHIRDILGCI